MSLVTLSNVDKFYGAEQILEAVSFSVERGDHIALVGSNGAGKSTLLRIMAGLEEPDSGTVGRARNARIVYLPQEPDFQGEDTLYEAMLEPFRDVVDAQERLRVIEQEMAADGQSPGLLEEYGRLQSVIEHGGYDYREQIERMLTGLELDPTTWHTLVNRLSGGQRTRANLARTLLRDADLLLLDEPSNHLDIAALEWLESYLRDLRRAFVIVAHDRYLLDHVTRRTLELSFRHVSEYPAPYSRYLALRAERMERQRAQYAAQQEEIVRTEEFIRRYGAGQRHKEARGRQKRLDRLERVERPREEESVHLRLNRARRTGDVVLTLEDLVAGYREKPLVQLPEEVVVRRGAKIAMIGPNGTGKTTLLKTLIGNLPALRGSARWGANVSIGYYAQAPVHLDDNRSVLEEIRRARPMSEEEARTYLGRFLFSEDDVYKTVRVLSGGERSRVALAQLILEEPNVLVLDEPTNHLDIASREALQEVFAGFLGTLLMVSHDRYLIDAIAGELWVVGDGRLIRYSGNYSAFAGGSAKRLDRDGAGTDRRREQVSSPEDRLRGLEEEAESLADRLSQTSRTMSLGQLSEMVERYSEVLAEIDEADAVWRKAIGNELRGFSA